MGKFDLNPEMSIRVPAPGIHEADIPLNKERGPVNKTRIVPGLMG